MGSKQIHKVEQLSSLHHVRQQPPGNLLLPLCISGSATPCPAWLVRRDKQRRTWAYAVLGLLTFPDILHNCHLADRAYIQISHSFLKHGRGFTLH